MAIFDYSTHASQDGKQFFIQPKTTMPQSIRAKVRMLAEKGAYQEALDQLKDCAGDILLVNLKAVLLLRLHQPSAAKYLLRSHIWNMATFSFKSDVPVHVQLNFATALLLTGQVSGALDIIKEKGNVDNEQATELLTNIRGWEKSLTVMRWLDWKILGIQHVKGEFPITLGLPGRFDWESERITVPDNSQEHQTSEPGHSHNLACQPALL